MGRSQGIEFADILTKQSEQVNLRTNADRPHNDPRSRRNNVEPSSEANPAHERKKSSATGDRDQGRSNGVKGRDETHRTDKANSNQTDKNQAKVSSQRDDSRQNEVSNDAGVEPEQTDPQSVSNTDAEHAGSDGVASSSAPDEGGLEQQSKLVADNLPEQATTEINTAGLSGEDLQITTQSLNDEAQPGIPLKTGVVDGQGQPAEPDSPVFAEGQVLPGSQSHAAVLSPVAEGESSTQGMTHSVDQNVGTIVPGSVGSIPIGGGDTTSATAERSALMGDAQGSETAVVGVSSTTANTVVRGSDGSSQNQSVLSATTTLFDETLEVDVGPRPGIQTQESGAKVGGAAGVVAQGAVTSQASTLDVGVGDDAAQQQMMRNLRNNQVMEGMRASNDLGTGGEKFDTTLNKIMEGVSELRSGAADSRLPQAQIRETPGLKTYTTSVPSALGEPEWNKDFGEKLVWLTNQKIQFAEIHLNPADMGPIEIKIHMQNDQANIAIVSQHASVRDLLDMNVARLRDMLADSGVNPGDVDVSDQSAQQQGQARDGEQSGTSGQADSSASGDDVDMASSLDGARTQEISSDAVSLVDYYA
ncbi:flagellar hook-length control protein [Oleiphilus messinensis]|uniref:Flagellar hook-length control protein n=2 Tax=Oleiphilus messinensis TaxID=141451 RepID=A0A1Y0IDK8_9GAMM|nr:flagellar hook-length control protein [Oleiphilus messinensis]